MMEQRKSPIYFKNEEMQGYEEKRTVSERDYTDCWETTPFNSAQFILNFDNHGKDVLLTGNLKELRFPENITIQNNSLNFDHIIYYISIFENLNVGDKESLKEKLVDFGKYYLRHQIDTILNILDVDDTNNLITRIQSIIPEWQVEDEIDVKTYLQNLRRSSNPKVYLKFLKNLFKDSEASISTLILKLDEKIKKILETNPKLLSKTKTAYDLGKEMNFMGSSVGLGFHPHPALFHDDWNDIRFRNGQIKAGIAFGNSPSISGGADADGPAMIDLYRKGWESIPYDIKDSEAKKVSEENKMKINDLITEGWVIKSENNKIITMQKDGQEDKIINDSNPILEIPIYVPPNMANIYLFKVPGLTPRMEKELGNKSARYYPNVKDHGQDKRDITVIVVTNKSRINPTKFSKTADSQFGAGRWLLLTNEGLDKFGVLKAKPNAEELDKPRHYGSDPDKTRRPNIPLPSTYYEAFS